MIRQLVNHVLSFRSTGKWLLLSVLVGIVAGCGGIAFQVTEQLIYRKASQGLADFSPKDAAGEGRVPESNPLPLSPLKLLLVMALGGLAAGCLVQSLAPEAEGHGTDAATEAFHFKRGVIRPIVPIIKLVASAITIGAGSSGGREGPIAQIGTGFGSFLATVLNLPTRDRRILLRLR